ncbi:hypothetical protein BROUX41_006639 [Berkeleyomyces rouxiae]|uniref:uncharacterized protein n=1 Tax=Berkeleyomyces rouxiae TaxID=2035830 RepID=UPI003B7FD57A
MQKSTQNATTSFFSSFTFGGTKSRPGTSSGEQAQLQSQPQATGQPQSHLHSHSRSTSSAPSPQPDFAPEFPPELAASASALNLSQQQHQSQSHNHNHSQSLSQSQTAQNLGPPGTHQDIPFRDRKPSFARKSSFSSPAKGKRRPSTGNITTSAPLPPPPPVPDISNAVSHLTASSAAETNSNLSSSAAYNSQGAHSPLIPSDFPAPSRTLTSASLATSNSSAAHNTNGFMSSYTAVLPAVPGFDGGVHSNIADLARKRINTLDYLRKAHEGRIFWFNTYQMERPDVSRMSASNASRYARRATNFLILGVSLPTVIDHNGVTPLEYLRSLNTLLAEFETFQQLHGENSSSSSLSRARLPQMFRRPGVRRRSSAATDLAYGDMDAGSGGAGPAASANAAAFAPMESDLFPGENYTHLLTPSLPFDPDFHETFATLCDVLIDCYRKLLMLIPTNRECTPPVAEQFAKADSKVRKIILQGSMKEFDDAARSSIKVEVANLNKVVLSGLM